MYITSGMRGYTPQFTWSSWASEGLLVSAAARLASQHIVLGNPYVIF